MSSQITSLAQAFLDCMIWIWIVLMLTGFVVFIPIGTPAEWKRRWFPRYLLAVSAVFLVASLATCVAKWPSQRSFVPAVMSVPMVMLFYYGGLRYTKFCDGCGSMQHAYRWFSGRTHCSSCGAELGGKPKPTDDLLE